MQAELSCSAPAWNLCHVLHGPRGLVASLSSLTIKKQKFSRSKAIIYIKIKSLGKNSLQGNEEEAGPEKTFAPA